jgi:hypothetical protein
LFAHSGRATLPGSHSKDDSEGAEHYAAVYVYRLAAQATHDTRAIAAGSAQEMRSAISIGIGVEVLTLQQSDHTPVLRYSVMAHVYARSQSAVGNFQEILTTQVNNTSGCTSTPFPTSGYEPKQAQPQNVLSLSIFAAMYTHA